MGWAGFVYVFKNISIGTTAIKEKEGMNLTENEGECTGGDGGRQW